MKPVKMHLLRTGLPWREEKVTHCGADIRKVRVVPPKHFYGKDRCVVCMGYEPTAHFEYSLSDWVTGAIGRGRASYTEHVVVNKDGSTRAKRRRHDDPIKFELQAFAELAARHRAEFDSLVQASIAEWMLHGNSR